MEGREWRRKKEGSAVCVSEGVCKARVDGAKLWFKLNQETRRDQYAGRRREVREKKPI